MKRLNNISLMSRLCALMLCAALIFGSCASNSIDSQPVVAPSLSLDIDLDELTSGVIEVDNSAHTIVFSMNSNTAWVIESDQEWCKLSASRSSDVGLQADITITLEENVAENPATRSEDGDDESSDSNIAEDRSVNITIFIENVAENKVIKITQTQRAFDYTLDILPVEDKLAISEGSVLDFMLSANFAWSVSADVDWVTFEPASGSASASYQTVSIVAAETNVSGDDRTATITVTCGGIEESFEIVQSGLGLAFEGDTSVTADANGDSFEFSIFSTSVDGDWEVLCDAPDVKAEKVDGKVVVDVPFNKYFMTRFITLSLKMGDEVGSNTVVIEQPMHKYTYSFGALDGSEYSSYNSDGSVTISHTAVQARLITPYNYDYGTFIWTLRDLVKADSSCISINFQGTQVFNFEIYGVGGANHLTTNGGGEWKKNEFALDDTQYSSALGEIKLTIFPVSDDVMTVNLYLDGVNVLSTERLNWLGTYPLPIYFGLRYNGNTTNKVTFESFEHIPYDPDVDGGDGSNPDINLSFADATKSVAQAGEDVVLSVNTDLTDWTVTSTLDGVDFEYDYANQEVTVKVPANDSVEEREFTLSIASASGGNSSSKCVMTQSALALELDFAAGNATTVGAAATAVTIAVESNVSDWTISADLEGVTFGAIDYAENEVIANVPENLLAASRVVEFTISTTSGGGATKSYSVTQDAAAVILAFKSGLVDAISAKGGDVTLAVDANVANWAIECDSDDVAIGAIDYATGEVVVTIPSNSLAEDVDYIFTISTSVDSTEDTFTVTQAAQGVELEFEDDSEIVLAAAAATTKTIGVYAVGVGDWIATCEDSDVVISNYVRTENGSFDVEIPENGGYNGRSIVITLKSEGGAAEYGSILISQPAGATFDVSFATSLSSVAATGETQTLNVTTTSIADGDEWVVACDKVGVTSVNNGDGTATVNFARNPYFYTAAHTYDLYLTSKDDSSVVGGKLEGISQDPITYGVMFPGAGSLREVDETTGSVKLTFEGGLQARLYDISNKYSFGTYTIRVSDIDKAAAAAVNIQILTAANAFFNVEIQGNYGAGSGRNILSINAGSGATSTPIDLLNSNQGLYDAMEELTLSVLPKDGDATKVVASVLINGTQVVSTEISDWVTALGNIFTPYIGLRIGSAVSDVSVMTIDSFVIEPYVAPEN